VRRPTWAWSINLLRVERSRIVELTSFVNPDLFPTFDLPPVLEPRR